MVSDNYRMDPKRGKMQKRKAKDFGVMELRNSQA